MQIPTQAVPSRRAPSAQGGTMLALGFLLLALGVTALFASFAATLATVLLFGVLLLVAGLAQLVHAGAARHDGSGWDLLGGLVYTVAGGLIVLDPAGGAIGLTLLLAVFFLLAGLLRLGRAARGQGAWLHGALDLLLGALIVAGWPGTAAWVIGLFLALELLAAGVALALSGAQLRRVAREGSARLEGPATESGS